MLEILLLSPYDGMSHSFWHKGLSEALETHLETKVTVVTLPPRYFSWRQRGNSLTFSAHPLLQRPYDLVIATSLTDVSALRGLNRNLATVPIIVYFHENQFAYPDRSGEGLVDRQLTSVCTALSADRVLFNSDWNRGSFMHGATSLLKKMPDGVPDNVMTTIAEKSEVLPVALPVIQSMGQRVPIESLRIVWNHRFEYDKGPALLLEIVEGLLHIDLPFTMSLLGQRYRQSPGEMNLVVERLSKHGALSRNGFIEDRGEYLECLSHHDIVLSTSDHEFQGIAVQEALLCGCKPLVPDRLVYPEYVPDEFRYQGASDAVSRLIRGLPAYDVAQLAPYMEPQVSARWRELIELMIN